MKQTGIDAIKDMIDKTGIRQRQIAELVDCAEARLSGYLKGKPGPKDFAVVSKLVRLVNNYRSANGKGAVAVTDFYDEI